ncbi:hypothetical protein C5S39_01550 [Candidatus Methanophagaceae archaeon]|jgi:hypothetical protein|nr:hypothetical protein C5S39_01550 [Methanophagales archaeon]
MGDGTYRLKMKNKAFNGGKRMEGNCSTIRTEK